ncbi:MAG: aminopeptidase P family protein [Clostridium sp.]|nr:Xaa-Pro peptidase family protein [Clostridium sp.]MBS5463817.1 aminopeptidase P family protein [Clostridium sp.]
MNTQRLEKVLKKMETEGLEQMIISDPYAIYYLTGRFIDPGERLLALYINQSGKNKIFINNLFTVPEDLGVEKFRFSDTDDYLTPLCDCVEAGKPLGIDKTFAARFLIPVIDHSGASSYKVSSICIDEVRACKDDEEREKMRAVSAINDKAMAQFRGLIHEGVTEEEIASKMLDIYKSLGADGYSFEPLVGFGANCALGHHSPDNTVLKEGDTVLFDVGCRKDGYCADMTRTFFYKKVPSEKHRAIYETVRRANAAAEAILKPGVPLCEVDKAARQIIEDAGYGPNFTHRLGHFIGLEVHEYGDVSSANTKVAEVGNIFSIEPGIYVEGEVGVRIEDLVLITEDGCEILNSFSKELDIVE